MYIIVYTDNIGNVTIKFSKKKVSPKTYAKGEGVCMIFELKQHWASKVQAPNFNIWKNTFLSIYKTERML